MRDSDGSGFWNRCAIIYDGFLRKDRKAYDQLGQLINSELTTNMKVLELAAGTGLLSQHIAGTCKELLITDFSHQMLRQAQQKSYSGSVSFEQVDATKLHYKEDTFDAVVISNALHIVPAPELVLANIKRVLKPDGIVIAPTFIRNGSGREKFKETLMSLFGFKTESHWTQGEYIDYLEQHGWTILKCETVKASFDIAFVVARKSKG